MSARKRKCPTPEKQRYKTYAEALWALRRPYKRMKAPTRAYRCRGGHYHLTSSA